MRSKQYEMGINEIVTSFLTPMKPLPKQKKRKDTDGKAHKALNARSSSKQKWGNEEKENFEKKHFKSDNGRRPGKKSDDQGLNVNYFDNFILRSKLTFFRKLEGRGREMTMNQK